MQRDRISLYRRKIIEPHRTNYVSTRVKAILWRLSQCSIHLYLIWQVMTWQELYLSPCSSHSVSQCRTHRHHISGLPGPYLGATITSSPLEEWIIGKLSFHHEATHSVTLDHSLELSSARRTSIQRRCLWNLPLPSRCWFPFSSRKWIPFLLREVKVVKLTRSISCGISPTPFTRERHTCILRRSVYPHSTLRISGPNRCYDNLPLHSIR